MTSARLQSSITQATLGGTTLPILLVETLCLLCMLAWMPTGSEAFSVLVPESQIFGKRELEGTGTIRKEIPLATLIKQSEDYRENIFKRAKSNSDSKPATCTCTCETKPADEDGSARKRLLASAGKLRGHHHKHQEAPATCTCSCETHPVDDQQGKKIIDSGMDQSPSLFWSPFDYESPMNDEPKEKQKDYFVKEPEVEESRQDSEWGHTSRYPWRKLPDVICFRDQCSTDDDCCMRYNICDRSAKVCVDCWYGASCTSERDCCFKYPICKMETYRSHNGAPGEMVTSGKCVEKV